MSQIIVFIGALQLITFCTHALGKPSDIRWGLLWANRSEKTRTGQSTTNSTNSFSNGLWIVFRTGRTNEATVVGVL